MNGRFTRHPPPPACRGARRARRRTSFKSCLQVLWPRSLPRCQVPAKFLPARSLARSFGQVSARLCSYTPLRFPPAARDLFLAGPFGRRASTFFRSKFRPLFGSAFFRLLATFGVPKAPQNGTKTSLFPPLFLSLFWLLCLTPNCTKKCHFGGARTMNPCGLASVCSMFGLLDARPHFAEKTPHFGSQNDAKSLPGASKTRSQNLAEKRHLQKSILDQKPLKMTPPKTLERTPFSPLFSWPKNGRQKRRQKGAKKEPKWSPNGAQMEPKWNQMEPKVSFERRRVSFER